MKIDGMRAVLGEIFGIRVVVEEIKWSKHEYILSFVVINMLNELIDRF